MILIKNVVLAGRNADILIDGKVISKIGHSLEAEGAEVIDGKGMTALPGFINTHTHAAMTLLRGLGEDLPLQKWLQLIWSYEDLIDDDMIYWGTKLAALEMIKNGTTCYFDMYWKPEIAVKASQEMGVRAYHTHVILDGRDVSGIERTKDACLASLENARQWESDLAQMHIASHAQYTVSDEAFAWSAEQARKLGKILHIHLSETESECADCIKLSGKSPVKYLDDLGVFGSNVVAAHCVWLDDKDVEILGNHRVNVAYNVNSNLKLASGYCFRFDDLRQAGANICIGTDGCASSNNLDMREAVKTCALVQKAWRRDPQALPIDEALAMSTRNAARALGLNAGAVEEGRLADIILVNTDSTEFIPDFNFKANFIYSANSSCIDTVIVNGKVLMSGRRVPGEEQIRKNAAQQAARLYKLRNK